MYGLFHRRVYGAFLQAKLTRTRNQPQECVIPEIVVERGTELVRR